MKSKYYGYATGHTSATPGTVNYNYDPFGRLETKSVAGGKTTRYHYNIFGEVTGIDYGNNGVVNATLTRNPAGLVTTAAEVYEDATGATIGAGTTTLAYVGGRLDSVQYDNAHSYLRGVKLDYKNSDAKGRSTGYEVFNGATSRLNVSYGYDTVGRLSTIGSAHGTFTYSYLPGSGIVGGYTGANPGNIIQQIRHVDFQNRISAVVNRNGSGTVLASVAYTHDAMDRRTQARREDGTRWNYAYNARGEVIGANRQTASGASINGLERQYQYDAIGNRTWAKYGGGESGAPSQIDYTVNVHNQYDSLTHPGNEWVVGRAPAGAVVNVNGVAAGRQETWFSREITQLQGAGGVGGLLAANVIKTSDCTSLGNLYASYDGNILAWSLTDGSVKQGQDYDPFGNVVLKQTLAGGPLAGSQGELNYGFSTKPQDTETKLLYYGYRYYDPQQGKWLGRDPIGELGGLNLYGMVGNSSVNLVDVLGLTVDCCDWPGDTLQWLKDNCGDINKFAKENGIDPRDLANALAEENSERGKGDSVQDALSKYSSELANQVTSAFHKAAGKGARNADVGPANINMDSAESVRKPGEFSAHPNGWQQGMSDYLNTGEGTADFGARLMKEAVNKIDPHLGNVTDPNEKSAMRTRACFETGNDWLRAGCC